MENKQLNLSEPENIMGTMDVNPLLIKLSIPMMISMLVQALYNVVDSIFVARVSENALTAVSLAFSLQNMMFAVGIGTGVGFVALCITSFAFMVRAFVETMEDVSQDCVESLQAVGATFPQRVAQAILPSCLSGFLSWFLYCVEVNIRASTIVGMVGGGGVGLTLFSYIKSFRYDIALTIILLIAAMVIVVDQITGKLRKELLK